MNCNQDCSNITLPSASDVAIQYSDDGSTWVDDPTSITTTYYTRFSLDGGDTWGNTITLPNPSTTDLTRIVHFYSNGTTGDTHDSGGTSYEELGTEYQMDNSSTVQMSVNGDTLIAEAYFVVPANANDRKVGLKIDTSSCAAGSTDLITHQFTPNKETVVKLRAEFTRVQNNGAQYFEGKYEVFGLPNVEIGQELNTLTIDFTSPDDIFIQPYCQELTSSSDDTVLKFFKVTLIKKQS